MEVFVALLTFWAVVVFGGKYILMAWRKWRALQPARHLSDISSVDYYRQLPPAQLESLVIRAAKAKEYTVLGEPWLGRAKEQGYLWKKGKKAVLVLRLDSRLPAPDLEDIAKQLMAARAEHAFVFFPFPKPPAEHPKRVEILAGKKLISWFSAIGDVVPPLIGGLPAEKCQCGSPMKERVSRSGRPMLVCTLFPDCRGMKEPVEFPSGPSRFVSANEDRTSSQTTSPDSAKKTLSSGNVGTPTNSNDRKETEIPR